MYLFVNVESAPIQERFQSDVSPFYSTQTLLFTDDQTLGEKKGITWIETLSWSPRAFVIHNFLSDEECVSVMNLANPKLERSTVVNHHKNNTSTLSKVRTSKGTFLNRLSTDIVTDIQSRTALLTGIPLENGEDLQVLEYEKGQKYTPHPDYFPLSYQTARDGWQRTATILFYLTDIEEGGETNFPSGVVNLEYQESHRGQKNFSSCSGTSSFPASFAPKKGDALLFFDMNVPFNWQDGSSLHQGCPVIKGIKWSSTIWMHQEAFRLSDILVGYKGDKIELCYDFHENCDSWADAGQCTNNKDYTQIICKKSCKIC